MAADCPSDLSVASAVTAGESLVFASTMYTLFAKNCGPTHTPRRLVQLPLGQDGAQRLKVQPGLTIRVTTGAPVPAGADAVVQVEDTELLERTDDGLEERRIRILTSAREGQDIRAVVRGAEKRNVVAKRESLSASDLATFPSSQGSDIAKGELVLGAGKRIGAAEVSILS